jgi:hypothetical protein
MAAEKPSALKALNRLRQSHGLASEKNLLIYFGLLDERVPKSVEEF